MADDTSTDDAGEKVPSTQDVGPLLTQWAADGDFLILGTADSIAALGQSLQRYGEGGIANESRPPLRIATRAQSDACAIVVAVASADDDRLLKNRTIRQQTGWDRVRDAGCLVVILICLFTFAMGAFTIARWFGLRP